MDSQLQSGIAGPPKQKPRSQLGIYVGHSPSHAGSVALALNHCTGHVSQQFHVVFDDLYSTVSYMERSEVPPNWAYLVENSKEIVREEDYNFAKMRLFPEAEIGDTMEDTINTTNTQTTARKKLAIWFLQRSHLNCGLCQTQALLNQKLLREYLYYKRLNVVVVVIVVVVIVVVVGVGVGVHRK